MARVADVVDRRRVERRQPRLRLLEKASSTKRVMTRRTSSWMTRTRSKSGMECVDLVEQLAQKGDLAQVVER